MDFLILFAKPICLLLGSYAPFGPLHPPSILRPHTQGLPHRFSPAACPLRSPPFPSRLAQSGSSLVLVEFSMDQSDDPSSVEPETQYEVPLAHQASSGRLSLS